MNVTRVIIAFVVILIAFGAYVLFQFIGVEVPKSKATIGEHTFSINVATTSAEQQKGLSKRNSLPQDQGMLFVFEETIDHPFWMKDMEFPIDIIFINDNKIVSIAKDAKPQKITDAALQIYHGSQPSNKVLEINAGLSDKYQFKSGDTLKFILK